MEKKGWVKKKLGDCFSYIKNGANIKQDKAASGIPITRIETLANGLFNRDRLGYADIFASEKYAQYILDTGDLLFSHINSKQYIGRTVLYTQQGQEVIIHGMNLLRLKVITEILTPNFVYYYFKSPFVKEQIASHRKDAVNQSSISITDLKRIVLFVPPLPEQEQIVAELDCLQGIIDKKKEQLQELDKLAQSIFYTMFGDPVENEKGWTQSQLGKECIISSSKRVFAKDFLDAGIPFYRGNEIAELSIKNNIKPTLFISKEHYDELKKATGVPIIGDVLLPSICPDGKIWLVNTTAPFYFKDGRVLWIHVNKKVFNGVFIQYYLKNKFILDFDKIASGTTFSELKLFILRELTIPLPPLPLQQEFADKITAIEQQKNRIAQSLQDTETLFQSRMDYYFG